MKKLRITVNKDSVIVMVAVLMTTCFIAGAALSFTYAATKDAIAAAEAAARLSSVRTVLPSFDGDPIEVTVAIDGTERAFYIGKKDDRIVGIATPASALGYGGQVTILVGVDPSGVLTGLTLLTHQETPGLGTKVAEPFFLSQFIGKSLRGASEEFKVKKDGGTIDAVTAATITSRAVAKAATEAIQTFLQVKEDIL
jgi:Na+-translocating ferredoxin:NAD+ oxidoreductase subunit G